MANKKNMLVLFGIFAAILVIIISVIRLRNFERRGAEAVQAAKQRAAARKAAEQSVQPERR